MAAAVVLPSGARLDDAGARWADVRDSKALTPRARALLAPWIEREAAGWAVGAASAFEIDALGIARATALAMRRALLSLPRRPDAVVVDGRPIRPLGPWHQVSVVRGDASVLSVASASVIAKVRRDAFMVRLAEALPVFGFERHVGYGAAGHRAALAAVGPSTQHRLTWRLMPDTAAVDVVDAVVGADGVATGSAGVFA